MRLSKITLLFGSFIVLSATFTNQLLFYFFEQFGRRQTTTAVGMLFILIGIWCNALIAKQGIPLKRKFFFFSLFVLGLILSWQIHLLAERIHILEYGLLGWFSIRDTTKNRFSLKAILLSFLIILFFGLLDEGFQFFLPQRVADWRDILLNCIGGCWGICLFFVISFPSIFNPTHNRAPSILEKN
jgi:hypothetical protein